MCKRDVNNLWKKQGPFSHRTIANAFSNWLTEIIQRGKFKDLLLFSKSGKNLPPPG